MFTALFALTRTARWVASWNKMVSDPAKFGRPRQLDTGPTKRSYVPGVKRGKTAPSQS
jgi:citrate synthase